MIEFNDENSPTLTQIMELEKLRRNMNLEDENWQNLYRSQNQLLFDLEIAQQKSLTDKTFGVIFEENGIVAIMKPIGLTSDEAKLKIQNNLYPSWANIHRLDKLVSGVLVGGLTRNVRSKLQKFIRDKNCFKIYCAIIEHNENFSENPIAIEHELKCGRSKKKEYKESCTYVETIWRNDLIRIVLCYPITGRPKQIRRHLAKEDSQIVSIDLPSPIKEKQVFLYLHSLLYHFNYESATPSITIRSPNPHWVSHIDNFEEKLELFKQNALSYRNAEHANRTN